MRAQKGFSLLELIVVIAILVAIAGIVSPYVLGMLDDAKVNKILETYSRVSQAVAEYRNDIMEGNSSLTKDDPLLIPIEEEGTHDLYYPPPQTDQARKGWKGPYLSHPLTRKDNPFGGLVKLWNTANATWNPAFTVDGWKIQGPNGPAYFGNGSFLVFTDVEEDFAKLVDAKVDAGMKASDGTLAVEGSEWSMLGKCFWEPIGLGATNCLYLFISDLDGK